MDIFLKSILLEKDLKDNLTSGVWLEGTDIYEGRIYTEGRIYSNNVLLSKSIGFLAKK